MRRLLPLVAVLAVGCQPKADPPAVTTPAPDIPPQAVPMVSDSAWTWAYFFPADDLPRVEEALAGKPHTVSEYRVDRVKTVTGTPGLAVRPGAKLVRVEAAARFDVGGLKPLCAGVPQHLEYTSREQKEALASSRQPLPASTETVVVLIPIRKSAVWWALPQDERAAHFRARDGKAGHTAIGATYTDRVYRKLYHTRYAVESTDHDFLTYFEFETAHAVAFEQLLTELRDTTANPEWQYVDREYEVWMTKMK